MKLNNLSAKKICRLISAGMVFSMLVITGILGGIMQDIRIFIAGGTLTLCAFFWIWLLVLSFGKRLSHFTSNLCRTLDNMIDGNEELQKSNDSETLFARINHRLIRLYEIMQENRHKVDMERQELQMLISDISHQVKTPVSNLQMVTDTLLTKPVSEEERMDFLQGIRSQTDKLDFLFQALVKTSRLETGAIRLEKKDSSLFHTLAQAMTKLQLRKVQQSESFIYLVGSFIGSCILGIPIGLLLCTQISKIPGLSYFEYHFPVLFVLLYFAAVVMVYHVVSVYQKKSLQQHSIIERIRTIG